MRGFGIRFAMQQPMSQARRRLVQAGPNPEKEARLKAERAMMQDPKLPTELAPETKPQKKMMSKRQRYRRSKWSDAQLYLIVGFCTFISVSFYIFYDVENQPAIQ